MRIMGIDNGLGGGLVLLDDGHPVEKRIMPVVDVKGGKREYAIVEIVNLFKTLKPEHVFLERAQSMPGQGVSSMFSIGLGYGMFLGILTSFYIPFTVVHPKTWQKVVFRDLPKQDTKAMAYIVCSRLWPGVDWRATERCRKPHDGLCDAAMIAEYGRREMTGCAKVLVVSGKVGKKQLKEARENGRERTWKRECPLTLTLFD